MAIVPSRKLIDDNDFERYLPALLTAAGVTPARRQRMDDGTVPSMIIALETVLAMPIHKRLSRKDWAAAVRRCVIKINSRTATITIASPAVVSAAAHGFAIGNAIKFSSTGALPTGLTVGPTYYVATPGFGAGAFQVSLTPGGASVITTGTQSGVHTVYLA